LFPWALNTCGLSNFQQKIMVRPLSYSTDARRMHLVT
jgi:hypothetical protein